jgi:hypothetical protein
MNLVPIMSAFFLESIDWKPINFSITSHPTNLGFKFYDQNGNLRRPTLWEECKHYYSLLSNADHITDFSTIKSWVGYDMDRHPEERKNIFTFTLLNQMLVAIVKYEKDWRGYSRIIRDKIDEILSKLENSFNENKDIDVINDLEAPEL